VGTHLILSILQAWTAWVVCRPRLVLGAALLSAVASVVLAAAHLDIQTDQLELISTHHPLLALNEKLEPFNFGGQTTFTVVVQAPEPRRGVAFLEALGARIRADSDHFQALYDRMDPNQLQPWALLYVDTHDLVTIRDSLATYAGPLHALARHPDLITFVQLLNEQIAAHMVGELLTSLLDADTPVKEAGGSGVPMALDTLIGTLEGLASFLQGSPHYQSPWSALVRNVMGHGDQDGYFWEGRKRYLLMIVVPKPSGEAFNNAQRARPFTGPDTGGADGLPRGAGRRDRPGGAQQ
jgi:hypothetical protein